MGVLIWCVWGLLAGDFEICSLETVTGEDGSTETRTCDGPSVTDAGVVAVALLILLMLAPDMSEVGVFGLSFKARLQAAEGKAAASEAKADKLETQLHMQSLRVDNLAAANAQATGNNVFIGEEFLKRLSSDLPDKGRVFLEGLVPPLTKGLAPSPLASDTQEGSPDRVDARLALQLIDNWEMLAATLDLPPYRPGRDAVPRVPVTAEDSHRFRNVFADELQIVRAARNTVAHSAPISNDDLQKAVAMSEQLLDILRRTPRGWDAKLS
ncbi:hypothetical protein [Mycobacterium sp. SMC-4]|uniref:hypothetical protein n=1 Tax=Mycobacterium sp. SMC-4 TaxID=2857059 RepID=UPI0021B1C3DC|nr:hypothetical protein [Mycobacterium sp. SMC-4]UXA16743.1 hypothetical protein KXD98_18425 [Mycobacterium sp. SMC-4]